MHSQTWAPEDDIIHSRAKMKLLAQNRGVKPTLSVGEISFDEQRYHAVTTGMHTIYLTTSGKLINATHLVCASECKGWMLAKWLRECKTKKQKASNGLGSCREPM